MKPKIAVLLSHYNGYMYLEQQVQSIERQVGVDVDIIIRDDGSTCTKSLSVLNNVQRSRAGRCRVLYGENLGACASFFKLVNSASGYNFYAFCDQDDYWLEDKLLRATNALKSHTLAPALYCSNLIVVDKELNSIPFVRQNLIPNFHSAFFYNICTGCTVVFNDKLREVFIENTLPNEAIMHDWWFYILGASIGNVIYDKDSRIFYRQHEHNCIGAETTIYRKMKRQLLSFVGRTSGVRYKQAVEFYDIYAHLLPPQKSSYLSLIKKSKSCFLQRVTLAFFPKLRLYSIVDTLMLKCLILTGKY